MPKNVVLQYAYINLQFLIFKKYLFYSKKSKIILFYSIS
jgi:hypothetical protein